MLYEVFTLFSTLAIILSDMGISRSLISGDKSIVTHHRHCDVVSNHCSKKEHFLHTTSTLINQQDICPIIPSPILTPNYWMPVSNSIGISLPNLTTTNTCPSTMPNPSTMQDICPITASSSLLSPTNYHIMSNTNDIDISLPNLTTITTCPSTQQLKDVCPITATLTSPFIPTSPTSPPTYLMPITNSIGISFPNLTTTTTCPSTQQDICSITAASPSPSLTSTFYSTNHHMSVTNDIGITLPNLTTTTCPSIIPSPSTMQDIYLITAVSPIPSPISPTTHLLSVTSSIGIPFPKLTSPNTCPSIIPTTTINTAMTDLSTTSLVSMASIGESTRTHPSTSAITSASTTTCMTTTSTTTISASTTTFPPTTITTIITSVSATTCITFTHTAIITSVYTTSTSTATISSVYATSTAIISTSSTTSTASSPTTTRAPTTSTSIITSTSTIIRAPTAIITSTSTTSRAPITSTTIITSPFTITHVSTATITSTSTITRAHATRTAIITSPFTITRAPITSTAIINSTSTTSRAPITSTAIITSPFTITHAPTCPAITSTAIITSPFNITRAPTTSTAIITSTSTTSRAPITSTAIITSPFTITHASTSIITTITRAPITSTAIITSTSTTSRAPITSTAIITSPFTITHASTSIVTTITRAPITSTAIIASTSTTSRAPIKSTAIVNSPFTITRAPTCPAITSTAIITSPFTITHVSTATITSTSTITRAHTTSTAIITSPFTITRAPITSTAIITSTSTTTHTLTMSTAFITSPFTITRVPTCPAITSTAITASPFAITRAPTTSTAIITSPFTITRAPTTSTTINASPFIITRAPTCPAITNTAIITSPFTITRVPTCQAITSTEIITSTSTITRAPIACNFPSCMSNLGSSRAPPTLNNYIYSSILAKCPCRICYSSVLHSKEVDSTLILNSTITLNSTPTLFDLTSSQLQFHFDMSKAEHIEAVVPDVMGNEKDESFIRLQMNQNKKRQSKEHVGDNLDGKHSLMKRVMMWFYSNTIGKIKFSKICSSASNFLVLTIIGYLLVRKRVAENKAEEMKVSLQNLNAESMQSKIHHYKKEIHSLSLIRNKSTENRDLTTENEILKDKVTLMIGEQKESLSSISLETSESLHKYQVENDRLNSELSTTEKFVEGLCDQLAEARANLSRVESELVTLQEDLNDKDKEILYYKEAAKETHKESNAGKETEQKVEEPKEHLPTIGGDQISLKEELNKLRVVATFRRETGVNVGLFSPQKLLNQFSVVNYRHYYLISNVDPPPSHLLAFLHPQYFSHMSRLWSCHTIGQESSIDVFDLNYIEDDIHDVKLYCQESSVDSSNTSLAEEESA